MLLSVMRKDNSFFSSVAAVRLTKIDAENEGQRLDNFVLRQCKGVPKRHMYKAIRKGEVKVNNKRKDVDYRVSAGDVVRIPPLRVSAHARKNVPAFNCSIVFEDEVLLILDKPAGLAVHGGSGISFGLIEQLRASRPHARFLELAHRLDRDTSGLLMVAKQRRALLALHAMLREGKGIKRYVALIKGKLIAKPLHIRLCLTKWTTQSGERRVRVDPEGQAAYTIVTLKKRLNEYSLVEAELRSGRTHQIRVHLAASGFPIVGDDKYGSEEVRDLFSHLGFFRMFLHAHHLTLAHPVTGKVLTFTAPLPTACADVLKQLMPAESDCLKNDLAATQQPRR